MVILNKDLEYLIMCYIFAVMIIEYRHIIWGIVKSRCCGYTFRYWEVFWVVTIYFRFIRMAIVCGSFYKVLFCEFGYFSMNSFGRRVVKYNKLVSGNIEYMKGWDKDIEIPTIKE